MNKIKILYKKIHMFKINIRTLWYRKSYLFITGIIMLSLKLVGRLKHTSFSETDYKKSLAYKKNQFSQNKELFVRFFSKQSLMR